MKAVTLNKCLQGIQALGYGFRHPGFVKKSLKHAIQSIYRHGALLKGTVPQKPIEQLFDVDETITFQNGFGRDGNVSAYELMIIALVIANHKPLNLLEIGTFDGNTTLQMALNAPKTAIVHTIDLPHEQIATHLPITAADRKFIQDTQKLQRKFIGSRVEQSIIQHLGDSTAYDFSHFTKNGPIDFCFIDGSHSYECVKSDTEKTLKILAPNGIILWHDFDPTWPGVYLFLCELSKTRSLVHITGTCLVLLV